MDEFYRKEKRKMDRWEKWQEKILPEKYWRDERVNMFDTTEYKLCFEDDPSSHQFNDLCYLIKLNMIYKARSLAKELNVTSKTHLRENGDTILHVCAEYG